jgi:hypothetical protein
MIEALREEDTAAAMIKAAREGDKQECERLLANDGGLKNAKNEVRKEHTAKHETNQLCSHRKRKWVSFLLDVSVCDGMMPQLKSAVAGW